MGVELDARKTKRFQGCRDMRGVWNWRHELPWDIRMLKRAKSVPISTVPLQREVFTTLS